MAAAFTLMMPDSLPAALPVVAGAAAGCLICDIDCDSPREKSDASRHRVLALIIAAAAVIWDYMYWKGDAAAPGSGGGMWQQAAAGWPYVTCAGIAGIALTLTFANVSSHRGFSHSILAMVLEAGFLRLVFPQAAIPFMIAFASHLVLDLTNKRPVRLFYPAKKGYCLGLYYADRLANRICAAGGTVWLIVILLLCFRQ